MKPRLNLLAGLAFFAALHPLSAQEQNKNLDRISASVRGHVKALTTGRFSERLDAAEALAASGPAAREAVPALTQALGYWHDLIPIRAAQALGRIGPAAKDAVPALTANLRNKNVILTQVRSSAAIALGQIALVDERVVPALLDAFDDWEDEVKIAAASSLKRIGPADSVTISTLGSALNSPNSTRRRAAAIALNQAGPASKEGQTILLSALKDRRWEVRRDVTAALGEPGPRSKDALPLLRAMLGDVHGEVRFAAAVALKQLASATGSTLDLNAAHGALRLPRVLQGRHRTSVTSLSFAPRANRLASVSADGQVKIWDLANGDEVLSWTAHRKGPCTLAFAPDTKILASGGMEGIIKLWDAASGQELGRLAGHRDAIQCLRFSEDGNFLASAGCDKTAKVWNLSSGKVVRSIAPIYPHNALALALNSGLVASEGPHGAIRLWDLYVGKELLPIAGHSSTVGNLAFSADGRALASATGGGPWDGAPEVKVWNLAYHKLQSAVLPESARSNPNSAPEPPAREIFDSSVTAVVSLALSPDGQVLAVGAEVVQHGWEHRPGLIIWDARNRTKLASLGEHAASITSLAFSPDGRFLASGSFDGNVRVWNVSGFTAGEDFRAMGRPKRR